MTSTPPGRLPVVDPADGKAFDHFATSSRTDVDRIVRTADHAQRAWSAAGEQERRLALRACGAAMAGHVDEIAELVTREQGKPLAAAHAEVTLAAEWFGHVEALSLPPEPLADTANARITLHRVPYGAVAAIAPSNFPIILAVTKIAPALLAGNAVVLKPSPVTTLCSARMVSVLRDVLPPGVLDIVTGAGDVGAWLAEHPMIGLVSFTGSVPTGQAIGSRAAAHSVKTILELGGNDACVVLPGTDVAAVAPAVFGRSMVNSGQFCAAIKRVYVSGRDYERFVDALVVEAEKAVVGEGMDPATEYGPLAEPAQRDRVARLVDDARRAGARIRTGGKALDRPGFFYPPTIVTDLPAGTELELAEQFGPVIPVIAYDTVGEAVRRANATEFGLGGSVWGDEHDARPVAHSLECGTVWVNTHGDLRPDVPFGGFRSSGPGVEYGRWGLLEYTRIKVLNESFG